VLLAPFGDGWSRVIAWNSRCELPLTEPADIDEVRYVCAAVLGDDFGMHDPRSICRMAGDERQVPRYCAGRVFFAGDAAHTHLPFGSQGINGGLQDAANLGWKLAAAVRGTAGPQLLDSYHDERHLAGRLVTRLSQRMLRPALIEAGPLHALTAMAGLAGKVSALADRAARAISGIALKYPAGSGAHRLAGQRAGDVPLRSGWHPRLYEALREGGFVLLAESEAQAGSELPPLLALWPDRVHVAEPALAPAPLVLVRPDGYVAWAADDRAPARRYAGLRQALGRWCGPPARQSAIPSSSNY